MIKVLADKNLYKIKDFLPDNIDLSLFDPSDADLYLDADTDALLVRTVISLNEKTIPIIPRQLRFIGTGSSGRDHIDTDYFENKGVKVVDAKGCNANAVAEYVITALLLWEIANPEQHSFKKVGVIGAGATGSKVIEKLDAFGIKWVAYDPPRQEKDSSFTSATKEELLQCPILTFHIPLTKTGPYPTKYWLNKEILEQYSFDLVINAARGGVIDEKSLLNAFRQKSVKNFILDVWENEPDFNPEMAHSAFLATPHIAGYSEQAKLNASRMLGVQLSDFFGLIPKHSTELYHLKTIDLAHINFSQEDLLHRLQPIREYDAALRDLINRPDKTALFRKLRIDRPYRYEFPFVRIREDVLEKLGTLQKLGVKAQNK